MRRGMRAGMAYVRHACQQYTRAVARKPRKCKSRYACVPTSVLPTCIDELNAQALCILVACRSARRETPPSLSSPSQPHRHPHVSPTSRLPTAQPLSASRLLSRTLSRPLARSLPAHGNGKEAASTDFGTVVAGDEGTLHLPLPWVAHVISHQSIPGSGSLHSTQGMVRRGGGQGKRGAQRERGMVGDECKQDIERETMRALARATSFVRAARIARTHSACDIW